MQGVITSLELAAAHSGFAMGKRVGWIQATGFWGIVSGLVAGLSWM